MSAFAICCGPHALPHESCPAPYMIAVHICDIKGAPIVYYPACVDDFGALVIVGGPL